MNLKRDLINWIKLTDIKLKKIKNSALFAIFLFVCSIFIKCFLENKQQDEIKNYEQVVRLKEQTIQNYKEFSDSLLKEIKLKEVIEKSDFEYLKKDSTLNNETDSLKRKQKIKHN